MYTNIRICLLDWAYANIRNYGYWFPVLFRLELKLQKKTLNSY